MRSVPEVYTMPDEYVWANYGMRPPEMRKVQIVKPTRIHGRAFSGGDVVTLTKRDASDLINTGKATDYPPLEEKEESPEDLAERRKKAFREGPYKVEITRACIVKGFRCEPGEVIDVCEDDALCLTMCGRGKLISKPGEEDITEKINRMIEEKLRVG